MSIIKNPFFISIVSAGLVFAVLYYYYNHFITPKKSNKKNKKTKKTYEINEVMIISALVVGLIAWFVALKYDDNGYSNISDSASSQNTLNTQNNVDKNSVKVTTQNKELTNVSYGGDILRTNKINNNNVGSASSSGDSSKSYTLLNSGLNLPKSDIKIPNVLIDYH